MMISKPMALAVSTATLALAASAAQAEEVRVYNWSDYIAEDTLEKFTEATGIEVVYDVYDSNEVLDAALLAGRSGYDVVIPSNHYLTRQISAGVYQELDHDKLPNMKNLNPDLMDDVESIDPGSRYSVPYMWGTNGIGYNVERVTEILGDDAPLDSWALIFDPEITAALEEGGCGISMLDSGDEMLSPAMAYLGLSPLSEEREDLEAAGDLIAGVRDNITYFHSSRYISDLANGDICVAAGYSGDMFQAAARAEEAERDFSIAYTIPKEGAALWFDMMAIPADAPNPDNAHAFINFILEPEIAADITEYVVYANPNLASNEFLDPEILNDPEVYPNQEVMDNLYVAEEKPLAVQRIRTRVWNRVKSGM
ncbi:polyamine ABC transporter substrate-binding protein [Halomonas urumqiensis]|uniref:Putrescine-binding periplasmic protein n=1 Tax=Halomonas urumqiensis TaxID=1684789 RepID=A0A2N7UG90_9GAMM|nr:polyamine ABC transporter substrate-binding protein [Halomonas urumqiensis]PMR79432.1 spermidine/putrescine ABC transporter substrate-binding protein PotF [Halomonas urumqiensis]PTB01446.1 polyamine ABC transporter substrate-binding protein [Halomonas urumqiensis]GHE22464.1 putrescine-binding periplasmic protein [Halomonas urumqiensis]